MTDDYPWRCSRCGEVIVLPSPYAIGYIVGGKRVCWECHLEMVHEHDGEHAREDTEDGQGG
jgi:hypothetical protein